MKNYRLPLVLSIIAILVSAGALYQSLMTVPAPTAGATLSVGGIPYYLYGSGVAASDSTITLTSFKQPVNQYPLLMADFGTIGYLTLEPGNTSRQEFVSFTGVTQNADGTATLTGVTRGLAPVSPYTASTTIQKAHSGGTTAVVSNPPQFYERFANKQNTQYITGSWGFQGTAPTSTICATANELCNKTYIDALTNQGAATSTESLGGISQLATNLQQASSTNLGANIPLVLQAKNATSSPGYAGLWTVITNNAGKIAQSFLDFAQITVWTALHTFSNGFLSTASSTVSSSFHLGGLSAGGLNIDSLGTVYSAATTTNPHIVLSTAENVNFSGTAGATTTMTIPAGAMTATAIANVKMLFTGTGANGTAHIKFAIGNGTASTTLYEVTGAFGLGAFTPYIFDLTIGNENNLASQYYLGIGTSTVAITGGFPSQISGTTAINTANQWYISFTEDSNNGSNAVVLRQRSVKIEK